MASKGDKWNCLTVFSYWQALVITRRPDFASLSAISLWARLLPISPNQKYLKNGEKQNKILRLRIFHLALFSSGTARPHARTHARSIRCIKKKVYCKVLNHGMLPEYTLRSVRLTGCAELIELSKLVYIGGGQSGCRPFWRHYGKIPEKNPCKTYLYARKP